MSITWTTAKGTPVTLELHTTKTLWADGDQVEVPEYLLDGRAGSHYLYRPTLVQHPTAGPSLKDGRVVVPIAPEVLAAVTALVTEYHAEVERRAAESLAVETEYQTGYRRVLRAMGE